VFHESVRDSVRIRTAVEALTEIFESQRESFLGESA
jgi:hypothetical protein